MIGTLLNKAKVYIVSPTILFCFFVGAQIFINTNKLYIGLLIIYLFALYATSKNILKTLWYGFVSTLLFQQGKYFISYIFISTPQSIQEIPVLYNVMFSDVILIVLLFVLKRSSKKYFYSQKTEIYEYVFPILLCIGVVSSFFSYFQDISFFYLLQVLKYFVLYQISKIIFSDKQIKRVTFEIIIVFLIFNGGLMLLQWFKHGPVGWPIEHVNTWSQLGRYAVEQLDIYRPGGTMDDPNLIASFMGVVLPYLYSLVFIKNNHKNWLVWLSLSLSFLGIILSGSRAVWLVSVVIGFTSFVFLTKISITIDFPFILSRKNFIRLLFPFIVLLPLVLLRLSTIATAFSSNGSGIYRLRHLEIAKDYLLNNPFGIGLHVFQYLTPMIYQPEDYSYKIAEPHNIIAQIGSEFGILGLLLFSFLFFRIMTEKYKKLKKTKNIEMFGIFISCITYLGISCFYPWFLYSPISEIFWIFMGLNQYVEKNKR